VCCRLRIVARCVGWLGAGRRSPVDVRRSLVAATSRRPSFLVVGCRLSALGGKLTLGADCAIEPPRISWSLGKLIAMNEVEEQINGCKYLFLTGIQELGGNRLRIVVQEGRQAGKPKAITVGASSIPDCVPIEVTSESAFFEIQWPNYIAYAVLNESYACQPEAGQSYTGKRLRIYTKSHFMDYLLLSTFATDEFPGPLRHYEICCEDQLVNVVSTSSPTIMMTVARAEL
jgi:hypothetical protein